MDQIKIGAFLKELRKEKGLTQAQVAEKFGTTDRSISRWETGRNLPDISLLVEIAEFYDIDVRELINGERRRDDMDKEVKEVASAMAEYAGSEKSSLLKWVRGFSIAGVVISFLLLFWQVSRISATGFDGGLTGVLGFAGIVLLFVITVVLALYTNGLLAKIASNKKFTGAVKVAVIVISVLAVYQVIKIVFIVGGMLVLESLPSNDKVLDVYDKASIVSEYSGDLDSSLFLFPDDTSSATSVEFDGRLHTGLFDTDGYICLKCVYDESSYNAEIERLSEVSCSVPYNGQEISKSVYLDESSYRLPAYVAVDGYDYAYEYALCDESSFEITYMYVSFVNDELIAALSDDLKLDKTSYESEDVDTLQRFSIYAYYFGDGSAEYGD